MCIYIYTIIQVYKEYIYMTYKYILPLVPQKAAAEVSKIGKPIGEVGCCESGVAERSH